VDEGHSHRAAAAQFRMSVKFVNDKGCALFDRLQALMLWRVRFGLEPRLGQGMLCKKVGPIGD